MTTYIKLNAEIVDCDLDSSRHWVSLPHTVKHYVYRGLRRIHYIMSLIKTQSYNGL